MKRLNAQPRVPRQFSLRTGLVILLIAVAAPVAVSASSQSFDVLDNKAQSGMLMSLTSNPSVAEPSSDKNASSIIGVLSPDGSAFDAQPGQVSIKTDGVANTLVSTQGGDVIVGDRITSSSLSGVGTKIKKSGWIVGIAQASLDSKTRGAVASTVTDSKGGRHNIYVSRIPVSVKPTYYTFPNTANQEASTVPKVIQDAADRLAGKHVTILALVLSFILLLGGVVSVGVVVSVAIKTYFTSISRQPLAKAILFRKLFQTFAMSALVLAVVCIGALAILRAV